MNPFFNLMEGGAGGTPAFTISSVLQDATSVVNWVVTTVTSNAVIAAAFSMGILVPVGVKAFKKISKVGK